MFIDPNDFSDRENDSDMIQAAIDKACMEGSVTVIPKRNKRTGKDVWNISKTLLLQSGVCVILNNCRLRLDDGAICNMFANSNARSASALKPDGRQRDITIKGIGGAVLSGGIHNGFYENNGIARNKTKYPERHISENCMLYFQNVENLTVDNITVEDQRYWAFCLYTTAYSRISNIRLISHSNVPNQDGVDILKGCHDVIIENITGCIGDNAVALLATDDSMYCSVSESKRDGDIYNITVKNVMVYGVGGCALLRILNQDGYRIYNVRIDNIIETSPWSSSDAALAQNPDLIIKCDENGEPYHERILTPGEEGYRCEAAVMIGDSYWYETSKAKKGDTFGISISNVMTHARYALYLNNTVTDSSFDNIRIFGNGFMCAYFGEGEYENLHFSNVFYDRNAKPHKEDEHIFVEWNNTKSDGFSCVYFNDADVKDVSFDNMYLSENIDSVFSGNGEGYIYKGFISAEKVKTLSDAEGISIREQGK